MIAFFIIKILDEFQDHMAYSINQLYFDKQSFLLQNLRV